MSFVIRPVSTDDRPWIEEVLTARWGGPLIATRGRLHRASALPGFVAVRTPAARAGPPIGLVTYRLDERACEVVSLDSLVERQGVGTALLAAVEEVTQQRGLGRVWLITTNDNTPALRFYQRRGYRLVAVHPGAIADSRRLKPSIAEIGMDDIPIRDEIELEKPLTPTGPP